MELYEKMDLLRQKTGTTYREARRALEATKGDVAEALVWLEERRPEGRPRPALKRLSSVLQWSTETKIRISRGGRTLAEFPVAVGMAGLGLTLSSPRAAFVGAVGLALLLNKGVSLELQTERQ